jgi:hypothetical protein
VFRDLQVYREYKEHKETLELQVQPLEIPGLQGLLVNKGQQVLMV